VLPARGPRLTLKGEEAPFNLQRCRVGGLEIAQRVEFLTSKDALTPSRPVQAPDHTLSAIDNFQQIRVSE